MLFFWLTCVVCLFASSAQQVKGQGISPNELRSMFMRIFQRLDELDRKVEKLELSGGSGSDLVEVANIKWNVTQLTEELQRIDGMNGERKEEIQQLNGLFEQEKLLRIEQSSIVSTTSSNVTQMQSALINLKEKVNKVEDAGRKVEDIEKKVQKINELERKVGGVEREMQRVDEVEEKLEQKSQEIQRLTQNLQSTEQKVSFCASKSEMNEMSSKCKAICSAPALTPLTTPLTTPVTTRLTTSLTPVTKRSSVCDNNPCHGGRCEMTSTGSSYRCIDCPAFKSGNNCENVKCDKFKKYFQRNDMKYVVLECNGAWFEAKRMCESEGMTLAMPKDETSTKFILDQLRPFYNKNVMKRHVWFWIGLKHNDNDKQWQWLDGSALGNYTGGWAVFKRYTDERCGILYLDGGSTFWGNFDCLDLSKFFPVYPVCEQRISVV